MFPYPDCLSLASHYDNTSCYRIQFVYGQFLVSTGFQTDSHIPGYHTGSSFNRRLPPYHRSSFVAPEQRSTRTTPPHSFPSLVFRKECLSQTPFKACWPRYAAPEPVSGPRCLLQLDQSWTLAVGDPTVQLNRGNEFRNLTLSSLLVQVCAMSLKPAFMSDEPTATLSA